MNRLHNLAFVCITLLLSAGWIMPQGQPASNLGFSGDTAAAYERFRGLATFEGYLFRDLKNHTVISKLKHNIPDSENNAYLKPTGVNLLSIHIDELPPGMFNGKHRGPVQGVICIISGRGYTILEPHGEEPMKIEWQEGDLVSIPANAWHQDFNLDSDRPARILGVGVGGLVAQLGIPRLPDPENERYAREFEQSLKKLVQGKSKNGE
jgi:gentisate 1,2-dioxygenase